MDDEIYGKEGVESAAGYEPMPPASPPPNDESSIEIDEAAGDLIKKREEEQRPIEPIEYKQVGGENAGETSPENLTVSAERAAADLANFRNERADVAQKQTEELEAYTIDALRALRQQNQLPQQPQTVEAQQPQPEAQPQIEQAPEQPGIDPEIAQALANPKVREALQQEVAQYETAGRAYADATYRNAQSAAASLLAAYPELQNISANEIPAAIKIINQQNPQRAQAIIQHIQRTNEVVSEWQKVQAAHNEWQKDAYKKSWAEFAKAEDAKFTQLVPEMADAETSRKIGEAAVSTLTNAGFSRDDLARAWNGEASISLRDHRAQILIQKAARYDEAMLAMRNAAARPVPQVQRPGSGGQRTLDYSGDQISELSNRLRQTGNVKDAAKLLLARRANNG